MESYVTDDCFRLIKIGGINIHTLQPFVKGIGKDGKPERIVKNDEALKVRGRCNEKPFKPDFGACGATPTPAVCRTSTCTIVNLIGVGS